MEHNRWKLPQVAYSRFGKNLGIGADFAVLKSPFMLAHGRASARFASRALLIKAFSRWFFCERIIFPIFGGWLILEYEGSHFLKIWDHQKSCLLKEVFVCDCFCSACTFKKIIVRIERYTICYALSVRQNVSQKTLFLVTFYELPRKVEGERTGGNLNSN